MIKMKVIPAFKTGDFGYQRFSFNQIEPIFAMSKLDIMHGLTRTMDTKTLKLFYKEVNDLEKSFR